MNRKKVLWSIGGVVVTIIILTFLVQVFLVPSDVVISGKGISLPGVPQGATQESVIGKIARDTLDVSDGDLQEKKVIKNGSLRLVVEGTDDAVGDITELVEAREGFVESLRVIDEGDRGKRAFLTVRVPVKDFTDLARDVKELAQIIEDEQINNQDVSERFIDMQARLNNLKAAEQQFLEVLKRAFNVEDILMVQDRLTQVRSQIESLEGQIKFLSNQVDLATLTITLSEEPSVSASLRDFRPGLAIKAAFQSLVSGLIVIFNLIIAFVIVWIPIIILALILLWILWKIFGALKHKFWS